MASLFFEVSDAHGAALLNAASDIRSFKRHTDTDLDRIAEAKMKFFLQSPKNSFDALNPSEEEEPEFDLSNFDLDVFEEISCEVDAIRSSYVAPGIHLNNYLEWQALDVEWDEVKHHLPFDADRPSTGLRTVSIEVHWGAVMLAIKGALDRIVRVLHFYYPGIASHTTWGRYDSKGKASGFMSVVQRGKASDELLAYFEQAYIDWIADTVAPRDALTHYKDPYSMWHLHADGHALVSSQHIEDNNQIHSSDIKTLCCRVQRWYDLADRAFVALAAMQPRALKPLRK